jgi:hypothetical protein
MQEPVSRNKQTVAFQMKWAGIYASNIILTLGALSMCSKREIIHAEIIAY